MAFPTAVTTATDLHPDNGNRPSALNNLSRFFQSTANNLSNFFTPKNPPPPPPSSLSKVILPPPFSDSNVLPLYLPLACSYSPFESSAAQQPDSQISSSSAGGHGGLPSTVKVSGLNSTKDRSGPAFVGQVFSMCDLSGTGLMAVSTHFDIPFLSKRTPEWLKKMFAAVTKSKRNGPVFRFFLDLGDAVSYVKQLNIPSGVVGACRLDLAYEHFKEKPHLFQFVPNEKQVKEANKLLKMMPQNRGKKKVEGVPVFSAENLDIAIATTDGIRWYTPYFFDKSTLDNILEESVEQHFHSLIQTRNVQRRREIVDDNLAAEVVEEMGDSMWEPPEVQEVIDEMGHPGIPLSVLSKAAEIQFFYAVDKVLLGNRWLRKATGIQPKFPYIVDSFEKRSTASFLRACKSSNLIGDCNLGNDSMPFQCLDKLKDHVKDNVHAERGWKLDFQLPFKDWLALPWLKEQQKLPSLEDKREGNDLESRRQQLRSSPLLPKITMVGISTGEAGQMNKATLKKTMEDLTKELERMNPSNQLGSDELKIEERDPLFVANIGDHLRTGSARLIRREAN